MICTKRVCTMSQEATEELTLLDALAAIIRPPVLQEKQITIVNVIRTLKRNQFVSKEFSSKMGLPWQSHSVAWTDLPPVVVVEEGLGSGQHAQSVHSSARVRWCMGAHSATSHPPRTEK